MGEWKQYLFLTYISRLDHVRSCEYKPEHRYEGGLSGCRCCTERLLPEDGRQPQISIQSHLQTATRSWGDHDCPLQAQEHTDWKSEENYRGYVSCDFINWVLEGWNDLILTILDDPAANYEHPFFSGWLRLLLFTSCIQIHAWIKKRINRLLIRKLPQSCYTFSILNIESNK